MNIKVLWIDDECKTKDGLISFAEQYDIDVEAVESHEEGMELLRADLSRFDAIVLDAKVKNTRNDEKTGLTGLRNSITELDKLSSTRVIPRFIFTGQPDYMKSNDFKESYGEYYIKTIDEDRLIQDIISNVGTQEEYKLKAKYNRALCAAEIFGEDIPSKVISLLSVSQSEKEGTGRSDFNQLRQIIERVVRKFYDTNFIPDDIYNGKGKLNQSSKYLSGNHDLFKAEVDIFPKTISFMIKALLNVTQDGSHDDADLNLGVVNFVTISKTSNLYRSCLYQLLDILTWSGEFLKTKPNPPKWKSLGIHGTIERDINGNYHCGTFSLSKKQVEDRYKIGDAIVITETKPNTFYGTSKIYPEFAHRFKKI